MVGVLIVLAIVVYSVAKPIVDYRHVQTRLNQQNAQIHKLQAENKDLTDRKSALSTPKGIEAEARQLGMIKRGEQAYVVSGLNR